MQNNDPKIQEAMRLAQTPAGQQFIATLQKSNGVDLQKAMDAAASGDFTPIKQLLSKALKDPQTQKLLEHLGK